MEDKFKDALREIDNLNKKLNVEFELGYTRGYSDGLRVGQEQLVEYISTEVRPIYVKIDDCKWIDLK